MNKARFAPLALVVSLMLAVAASCSSSGSGELQVLDLSRIQGLPLSYPIVCGALDSLGLDSNTGDLEFSGYQELYRSLIDGNVDLIFAGKPDSGDLALIEGGKTSLDSTPLWKDALVFTVSTQNPVNDVSLLDIKGLANGEVAAWDEWGFACPVSMKAAGKALVDPEWGFRDPMPRGVDGAAQVSDLAGVLELGYYSFASADTSRKMLSIGGILPDRESIADGTYPFVAELFAVKIAGKPDSQYERIVRFLKSDEGQRMISQLGQIPLKSENDTWQAPPVGQNPEPAAFGSVSRTAGLALQHEDGFALDYTLDTDTGRVLNVAIDGIQGNREFADMIMEWVGAHGDALGQRIEASFPLVGIYSMAGSPASCTWNLGTGDEMSLADLFYDDVDYVSLLKDNLFANRLFSIGGVPQYEHDFLVCPIGIGSGLFDNALFYVKRLEGGETILVMGFGAPNPHFAIGTRSQALFLNLELSSSVSPYAASGSSGAR